MLLVDLRRSTSSRHQRLSSRRTRRVLSSLIALLSFVAVLPDAYAGGPRWVSGAPYFQWQGVMVTWYTNQPLYFTDPGDLSPYVNHAAADALVKRAASVWNIPTSSLTLAQGGSLAEHVSSTNVSAGPGGLTFPADVQSSNYLARQIAVIYDSDGSVTDLLLGSGASDPTSCLQNAVTESVDSIAPNTHIQHALLILNGLCTGPEPEKQLQMQYQLMRAFGRVLGLGWSQTNDNVFTGSPTPTYNQALNWPIMHPIDILCGAYTYQCLPQPFTLRPDDIASLQLLYFISDGTAPAGKQDTRSTGGGLYGKVLFPNGQGMEGVNVVVRRMEWFYGIPEQWEEVSAVTGIGYRWQGNNRLTAPGGSLASSMGATDDWKEGYWAIAAVPVPSFEGWEEGIVTTQPINPLYTGTYAIGSTIGNTIAPSGAATTVQSDFVENYRNNYVEITNSGASSSCAVTQQGTESTPIPAGPQGIWTGAICSYQQVAWSSFAVKANRTLTVEVAALDEKGLISTTKMMPVIGVWNTTDPFGGAPTVGVAKTAFGGAAVGITSLPLQSASAGSLRMVISDQRGLGRPDFNYQARVLYADSISPASVSASGGSVSIVGTGFRPGNLVLVNGVAATVTSVSPTLISAIVPSLSALGLSRGSYATITVRDASTGGSTSMTQALSYAAPVDTLQLVSAPSGSSPLSLPATIPFTVKAIAPDGTTAIAGESITISASGAGATLQACGAATCTVVTNANGLASSAVVPTAPGTVTLIASGRSGTVTASFTAAPPNDQIRLVSAPSGVQTSGSVSPTPFAVQLLQSDGSTPRPGTNITVGVTAGSVRFLACGGPVCTLTTDSRGFATTQLSPLSDGAIAIIASSASAPAPAAASFSAAPETMQLVSAPNGTLTVGIAAPKLFAVKVLAGDGATPVTGEPVVFSSSGSAIRFGSCGASVCTVTTDSTGLAQSTVVPLASGSATLSAVATSGSATTPVTSGPESMQILSTPPAIVPVQTIANTSFSVHLLAADGSTPVAGELVTFSATAGAALLGNCGSAVCTTPTDAQGNASVTVSPLLAGTVVLTASSLAGTQTSSFLAAVRQRAITATPASLYVAESTPLQWSPQIAVVDTAASIAGVPVAINSSPGLSFSAAQQLTGADGTAALAVAIAPISAGGSATATACAWVDICTTLAVQAVSPSEWRPSSITGADQSISTGENFKDVVFTVADAAGHPVAGASVHIFQTVNEWQPACTDSGRCPPAQVYTSSQATAVSGLDGTFRVTPTTYANLPVTTRIAIIAGTQGFSAVSVERHP